MTAETKTAKALQWRDRTWSEVDFPWDDDGGMFFDYLARKNGWRKLDELGDTVGTLSVTTYERRDYDDDDAEPLFFVNYSTSNRSKMVVLPRLQDLIDFLAHVSPTMLASMLPGDTSMILYELFEKTDYRAREREREREREADRRARARVEK